MKPCDVAQKVKAGRGWLVVRNSATLADTDYEHIADQIVDALNKRQVYPKLVAALRAAAARLEQETDGDAWTLAQQAAALLAELGESK